MNNEYPDLIISTKLHEAFEQTIRTMDELENELLLKIAKKVLNHEPVLADAGRFRKVYSAGKPDYYALLFDAALIGYVTRSWVNGSMIKGIVFTPTPEFK